MSPSLLALGSRSSVQCCLIHHIETKTRHILNNKILEACYIFHYFVNGNNVQNTIKTDKVPSVAMDVNENVKTIIDTFQSDTKQHFLYYLLILR